MRQPDDLGVLELEEDDPLSQLTDELESLGELEGLLREATAKSAEDKQLVKARRQLVRVSRGAGHDDERLALIAEIHRLEEGRVWITVGAVALFNTQQCGVCLSEHRFFLGWYTDQRHATDPNCRRLIRGKPVERLPERAEYHPQGTIEICSHCVESQLAINIACGEAPGAL